MILVDANIVLYAHDETSSKHKAALDWWQSCLQNEPLVGVPWLTVSAFLRITTHSRALLNPLHESDALAIVDSWLQFPSCRIVAPGPRFWPILKKVVSQSQCKGALMTDAFLAALTIENAGTFATNDLDFKRFQSLRTVYPLI